MSSDALWFGAIIAMMLALGLGSWWLERRSKEPARDLPEGTPYKIFTTQFDVEVRAEEIANRLEEISWDHVKYWQRPDEPQQVAAKAATERRKEEIIGSSCFSGLPTRLESAAITFLIDHSGSMRGDKIWEVCAAMQATGAALEDRGAKVEVLGFTTAGWRGGRARELWHSSGRPEYPGRLCALLHIIYKSFDEPMHQGIAWEAMLNGGALYENVDGEALDWAAGRLLKRAEANRLLIILSDGAPVDDSTLHANGVSILHRHVLEVADRLSSNLEMRVGGVGIGHDVSPYYRASTAAGELDELPAAIAKLLVDLL